MQEGTEEYSNKKQEFNLAMKQVSEGMTNANNSYTQINDGIFLPFTFTICFSLFVYCKVIFTFPLFPDISSFDISSPFNV